MRKRAAVGDLRHLIGDEVLHRSRALDAERDRQQRDPDRRHPGHGAPPPRRNEMDDEDPGEDLGRRRPAQDRGAGAEAPGQQQRESQRRQRRCGHLEVALLQRVQRSRQRQDESATNQQRGTRDPADPDRSRHERRDDQEQLDPKPQRPERSRTPAPPRAALVAAAGMAAGNGRRRPADCRGRAAGNARPRRC